MPRRPIVGGYGVSRPLIEYNFTELYLSKHLARLKNPIYIGSDGNFLMIEADGSISFAGDATVWEDLREPLTGKNLYSVPGSVDYDFIDGWVELSSGGSLANAGDTILINYQLPHATKEDSSLFVHMHWLQDSATERTLAGRYRILPNGAATSLAWTSFSASTLTDSAFTYTSGTIVQITSMVMIPLTGAGLSAIVQIQFTRDDSASGATMRALTVDAHYEIDTIGSREILTK